MTRCRPAPEGWGAVGLLALLLLSHRGLGYASSSRLARSPNRLQQMAKLFFRGPLLNQAGLEPHINASNCSASR